MALSVNYSTDKHAGNILPQFSPSAITAPSSQLRAMLHIVKEIASAVLLPQQLASLQSRHTLASLHVCSPQSMFQLLETHTNSALICEPGSPNSQIDLLNGVCMCIIRLFPHIGLSCTLVVFPIHNKNNSSYCVVCFSLRFLILGFV